MELESEEDGTTVAISKGCAQSLGRTTPDRTVSRRHLSLQIVETGADPRLCFEVIGKNPVLVLHGGDGGERRRRICRVLERGELRDGDRVSLSLRSPRFYRVKEMGRGVRDAVRRREERTSRRKREEEEEARRRESEEEMRLGGKGEAEVGEVDLGFEALDVSELDPLEDFGFLVRGHEFDNFPSQKIRPIGDWNWFLEDPRVSSDEEEDLAEETNKRKKRKRVKKRKSEDMDDEVWTGESEDGMVSVVEVEGAKKHKYSMRSQDQKKQDKDADSSGKSRKPKAAQEVEEDGTLGGFIVNDDEEVEQEVDEEEEEDFDEDEDY